MTKRAGRQCTRHLNACLACGRREARGAWTTPRGSARACCHFVVVYVVRAGGVLVAVASSHGTYVHKPDHTIDEPRLISTDD